MKTESRRNGALYLLLLLPAAWCTLPGLAWQSGPAAPVKTKTAGEAFKNVQVMKDMPEDQWFATMSFFTVALGVSCDHCHEKPPAGGDWAFEKDTPVKLKARRMISMVREINANVFNGEGKVSCNSCHRGTLTPVALPAPDMEHWLAQSKPPETLPDADGLIEKYRKATGLSAEPAAHTQRIQFRTTTYLWKTPPKTTTTELLIGDAGRIRRVSQTAGHPITSVRNGENGWIDDGTGQRVMQGDELRSIASEAATFSLKSLREITAPRTLMRDRVHDREAYVVEAVNKGSRTWFFFDARTGYLLRQRTYFPSFFADACRDVEFDDYRPAGRLMVPFTIRVINPAGSGVEIFEASMRALDPKFDTHSFEMR
jgi:hypothetical protein